MELQNLRLLTEYRLVVSAGIPRDDLVANLAMLAQAGLHGMVTEGLRFEINGRSFSDVPGFHRPDAALLRPPTDPRIETAARELRKLSRRLEQAAGVSPEAPDRQQETDDGRAS